MGLCKKCKLKQALYNYEGLKAEYCGDCRKDGMINVNNKKCVECKLKQAVYNYEGLKAEYCGDCRKDGMINVKDKKCIECNIKRPNFNYKDLKPLYCGDCRKDDMVDVLNKRCIKCNIKQPNYNYHNEKQGLYCFDCRKNGMIDILNKRCIECELFYVSKRTNYLCGYCNKYKSKRVKTKEIEVKKLLELNNIEFIHDKQISNKCCYKYRPDFIIDCLYYYLIVEVDEDAHRSYDKMCELIRMNNIQLSLELPTKFIRYNPDKKGIKKNIKEKELLERVKEWMKKDIKELKTEEAVYLFY